MCDLQCYNTDMVRFYGSNKFDKFLSAANFHFIYNYEIMFISSNLINFHSVTYFRFYIVPTFNFCSIGITL